MANITLKRFNGTLWEEMKVASEWSIVEGKPATFPPSGHGHNASDITSGEFNRLRVREIVSKDTRNTEDDPDSSLAGARFDFKSTTASGLVDGGSYNGIMTYRPYGNSSADFSGGPSHQLGFSGGGNLHHRTGDGSG